MIFENLKHFYLVINFHPVKHLSKFHVRYFQFTKVNGLAKCPLESSVTEDECVVAGLSVGGTLGINNQNNRPIVDVGSWDDKPSGCFLTKTDDIVHYNTNPVGSSSTDHVSVCHEIKVIRD